MRTKEKVITKRVSVCETIDDPTWYQLDLSKLDFPKSRIAKLLTSGWLTPATA